MHATEAARATALWIGVALVCSSCATAAPDREQRVSGGRIAPMGGGSGTGSTGGVGGSTVSFGGLGNVVVTGTGGEVPSPTYERRCIEGRLAGSPTAENSQDASAPPGSPGMPSDAGRGDGNVDLNLGAGDLTLLVVFDKSGSMSSGWDERSKWQVANEAFMKAIDPVIDNLTIGTIFFPQPDGCNVAPLDNPLQMNYAPGRAFMSNWRETEASRSPNGSTPLELAFDYADLAIERGCGLGLLNDRFRVVLITDGEPTCSDDTAKVVALAGEWNRLGVETWVMGLPGSAGATELLDAIAHAGGTGKAQMLGTPTALDNGLAAAAK